MNTRNRLVSRILFALCSLLVWSGVHAAPPAAAELKDADALHGLRAAKGVFMLDVKDPGRMAHVLNVVEQTSQGMTKQGVKPELVVVVIGPSVAFLTKDRRGISYMDERAVTELQGALRKLKELGVRIEACGIAMKGMDVRPDDLIPEVTAVGNGYISVIGYQAQGYQLVPVY